MTFTKPPLPVDDVYDVVRAYRSSLAKLHLDTLEEFAYWQEISWGLTKDLLEQLIADAAAEAAAEGEVEPPPTPQWVFRQVRFQQIVSQLRTDYKDFLELVLSKMRSDREEAVQLSLNLTRDAMEIQLDDIPRILQSYTELNVDAVREMVLQTMPGPVQDILLRFGDAAVESVREALVKGITLGESTAKVSRRVRAALGNNAIRANTIVRTEMMRAFREASRIQMIVNSQLLEGWVWESALSATTCPICWSMHGTFFPFEAGPSEQLFEGFVPIAVTEAYGKSIVPMYTHPNCRCVMVPRVRSYADILNEPSLPDTRVPIISGEERFALLSPEEQRAILGAGRYELYKEGMRLFDMVWGRYDPVWGGVRGLVPLKEIRRN